MVVELDFSKEERDAALERCGFVTEKITGWYDGSVIQNDTFQEKNLKPFNIETAYPRGNRPEVLSKDKPLLDEVDSADSVFAKLLKKVILDKLF